MGEIEERFEKGAKRMTTLDTKVDDLIAKIQTLLEVFEALKGAFQFLGWLAVVAKWFAVMAAGGAALWAFLHAILLAVTHLGSGHQ